MGLGIAIKAFTASLFNAEVAERVQSAIDGKTGDAAADPPRIAEPPKPAAAPAPVRSDAITLLSALQREARLVDLIQEDLTNFSDAQVGAAARPCLQSCKSTLERLLGLAPVDTSGEGATVRLDGGVSAARYQWIGEGDSTSGKLIHQGWQSAAIDLPQWTGDAADARVIAPAQVQR